MVIRKPYAFLIKNFRKIHIVLLFLTIYIYFKLMNLYSFLNTYVSLQSYSASLDSIDKYVSFIPYLAIFAIIIITGLIIYLLMYKKKPWKLYLIILIEYLLMLIAFYMASSYFHNYDADSSLSGAMAIRDTLFIASLPQYVVFVILFIRIAGIDLSKFDFKHDEEFIELSAEDREEFELNIDVDKESFKRKFRKLKRNLFYLYQEHKFIMNALIVLVVLGISFFAYYNIFILNKVYKQGEVLNTIGYSIRINKAYFTDSNYRGEKISNNNFVILDLTVKNNSSARSMNVERFHIMNKDSDVVTTKYYNRDFRDLGPLYDSSEMKKGASKNFILVYKVSPDLDKNKFSLYYQTVVNDVNSKLIKIKLNLEDIRKIKTVANVKIGEQQTVQTVNGIEEDITIKDYEIGDSFDYNYTYCSSDGSCAVNTDKVNATPGNKILKLNLITSSIDNQDLVDFSLMYGKIKYEDSEGNATDVELKNAIGRRYLGNILYLNVPEIINSVNKIDIIYTLRNKRYIFNIK